MVIYLRHPVHGNKVAIAEAEAVYDETNGWERYDAGALLTPIVSVNELAKPRGRPRKEMAA
tara:strand:- start:772 stop:954 length:183 start_codon:yes stop_codon:yes gene_type:complete